MTFFISLTQTLRLMKNQLLLFILLFVGISVNAQKSYKVEGMAYDTLNTPLVSATVMLLDKQDSTMLEFTTTGIDGFFEFKKIPAGEHLVKVTYVGYIPLTLDATSTDGSDINYGKVELKEIAEELMEVVIKAAKAPIVMRGDTIEYDATTFIVPEGSSVEDLLRQLPGVEVDQDGSIMSEGKDVTKVTVDGKSFFGQDPKAATKNLPAEGISKVQVFDRKSEEEEITGITGDSKEKEMNLQLKDEFKKGGFGKVVGGLGTESRAELKGNYNKFNKKMQFSIVGVGNNTGRNGLSWDDYQDFMGSNSFNFGGDGDYGFGGGGRGYSITFGGNDDDIESSIQSVFFSGGNNGGFPENYNGGLNYNYDDNGNKLSSVYYYNQAGITRESSTRRQSFFDNYTIENDNNTSTDNISRGHRGEFNFEKEIDSLNTVKINLNLAAMDKNNFSSGTTRLSRDQVLSTLSDFSNQANSFGYLINAQGIWRKKFKKKGRRLGFNASFLNTSLDEDGSNSSTNDFYNSAGEVDSVSVVDQISESTAVKNEIKANAIFVEPLSSRFFFQTFYNFSNRNQDGDRDVLNVEQEMQTLDEFLSRTYENTVMTNRIGAQIRYSFKGFNISAGAAYQAFNLDGQYTGKGNAGIEGTVDKTFTNWIPNFNIDYPISRTSYLSGNYSVSTQTPSISNLQPIVDNRNPLFISEGNPDLIPSVSHSGSIRYNIRKPASSFRFSTSLSYSYNVNEIIREETVDDNLVTYSTLTNFTGGQSANIWSNLSLPLLKNKITLRMGYSFNNRRSYAIVNDIENETTTISHSPSFRLNITPNQDYSIYANARFGWNDTKYNINTSQDQQTTNNRYGLELNAKTVAGIFFNSDFSYSQNINERFGVDQTIPIMNLSMYRRFLKGDQLEARLSLYDAFNRNTDIGNYASGNSVTTSQTLSLGRYFMFSLSYNIRGFKSDVRRDGWW